jgi:4a-hydroxytetrahydrobiopterin dehydratase
MQPMAGDEVTRELEGRRDWSGDAQAIRREVEAPTFLDAIRLVDAVAVVAEELDHHPDIDIRWRTVTFGCSTHVASGVTSRDFALADRIDALVRELFG